MSDQGAGGCPPLQKLAGTVIVSPATSNADTGFARKGRIPAPIRPELTKGEKASRYADSGRSLVPARSPAAPVSDRNSTYRAILAGLAP